MDSVTTMLMASIRDSYPGVGVGVGMGMLAQLNQLGLGHHMMQAPGTGAGAGPAPARAPHRDQDALDQEAGPPECHSPPISRTYTYKKVTKPLLERKRRARINRCLDELKELMVGALEAEGENVSKLEKADILELTVRHLQRITRPRDAAEDANRFQAGFSQCASEACHFLLGLPGLDAAVGQRLVAHLSQVVSGLRPYSPHPHLPSSPSSSPGPASPEVSSSTTWGGSAVCSARGTKREAEDSDDDPDSDVPVNYTSEALRQRKHKQPRLEHQRDRDRRVSSSSAPSSAPSTPGSIAANGHGSDDEDKGPMWRPW